MNGKSVLCTYIAAHPNWEQDLADQYGIKIRREGPYAIFNYGIEADFSDPVVQEARGIILDVEELEVVCWPFRKFGNFNESYADPIDWASARVQEKVDGSIIKLWFSKIWDRWIFSTNGVINADNANVDSVLEGLTFGKIIRLADNYGDLDFSALNQDKTYIFELVSPQTMVVVNYHGTSLYHIGTRSNLTGEETREDIGIRHPEEYPLHSLSDCIEAAKHLNEAAGDEVDQEGFVVVDKNWHRVKVKSPEYLVQHHIKAVRLTHSTAVEMVWSGDAEALEKLSARDDESKAILQYYMWQKTELEIRADRMAEIARRLYEEYSHERKAVAQVICKNDLSGVGFAALDNTEPGRTFLSMYTGRKLASLIPPYPVVSYDWVTADGRG